MEAKGNRSTQATKTVIELSMSDLKAVVAETIREEREKAAAEAAANNVNLFITRSEAANRLNVTFSTLNRWEKTGYLKPVRAGRKVYYKIADIEAVLK